MPAWECFEDECTRYLNKCFGTYAKFTHKGGTNSTVPDILVETHVGNSFYIEVKESSAQSGQFVLLPDENNRRFVFSSRNKTESNLYTEMITEHMNNNFDRYIVAGTAGCSVDIDKCIFEQWIVNSLKAKGVKFIITKGKNYVIFPISRYGMYFDIDAKYRLKRSGSSEPSIKNRNDVINWLENESAVNEISIEEKKIYVKGNNSLDGKKFNINNFTYLIAPRAESSYEIRKLSNTSNMNVIFSINLIKEQYPVDLVTFKSEF